MDEIYGFEYSGTRRNEYNEIEYYIDGDWYTKEEVKEMAEEISYWNDEFPNEGREDEDGLDWN